MRFFDQFPDLVYELPRSDLGRIELRNSDPARPDVAYQTHSQSGASVNESGKRLVEREDCRVFAAFCRGDSVTGRNGGLAATRGAHEESAGAAV